MAANGKGLAELYRVELKREATVRLEKEAAIAREAMARAVADLQTERKARERAEADLSAERKQTEILKGELAKEQASRKRRAQENDQLMDEVKIKREKVVAAEEKARRATAPRECGFCLEPYTTEFRLVPCNHVLYCLTCLEQMQAAGRDLCGSCGARFFSFEQIYHASASAL